MANCRPAVSDHAARWWCSALLQPSLTARHPVLACQSSQCPHPVNFCTAATGASLAPPAHLARPLRILCATGARDLLHCNWRPMCFFAASCLSLSLSLSLRFFVFILTHHGGGGEWDRGSRRGKNLGGRGNRSPSRLQFGERLLKTKRTKIVDTDRLHSGKNWKKNRRLVFGEGITKNKHSAGEQQQQKPDIIRRKEKKGIVRADRAERTPLCTEESGFFQAITLCTRCEHD